MMRRKSTAFLADVTRLSPPPVFEERAWGRGYMHTSIYLNIWVRVLLSVGWRLGCKQKHMRVLYGGKFLKEKTFMNSEILWLFAKVFSAKFWHMASFGGTSEQSTRVSHENLSFHQLSKVFLPRKFLAIWYRK